MRRRFLMKIGSLRQEDRRWLALLPLVLPALVIGVASSLLLMVLSVVAESFADLIWEDLPSAIGASGSSGLWTFLVLTLTGIAVGAIVWLVPGHGGPDPATEELVSPPQSPMVLPGLALAAVVTLAGGVSLGPELPITAINVSLASLLGRRILTSVPPSLWVMLAISGTIGAMFGTPVAAALILSSMPARPGDPPLWQRLFAPLVAAGAGGVTTVLLATPDLSVDLAPYTSPELIDLLSASMIAVIAAIVGLGAVYAFPVVYGLFHRLGNPVLIIASGGIVLGLLGVLGGPLTLFKGLEEMKELATTFADYSNAELAILALVKLAALVVAGTCGFRGGRVFPAIFVGVALGLLAHSLVPAIPPAICVTASILGILLATTRDGWISLFIPAVTVPEPMLISILLIAMLPAWLVVSGKPEMLIKHERHEAEDALNEKEQPA